MDKEATAGRILETVPGGPELLAWFGYVPSFHDAEIIGLHLNRTGPSTLSIHTWDVTDKVDSKGFFVHEKDVVVTFTLEEIENLELEGFSHQNVIGGLALNRMQAEAPKFGMQSHRPPRTQPDFYEIVLHPCYGLAGIIRARLVSITLSPGKPAASS
jgi:hypothetical protein